MINVNLFAFSPAFWLKMTEHASAGLFMFVSLESQAEVIRISYQLIKEDLHPSLPSLIINRLFSILVEHCQSLLTNLGHLQCMSAILSNCTLIIWKMLSYFQWLLQVDITAKVQVWKKHMNLYNTKTCLLTYFLSFPTS